MRGLWLGAALVAAFALAGCQTGGPDRPDMRSTAQEVRPGSYTGVWVAEDGSPGSADSGIELDTVTPDRDRPDGVRDRGWRDQGTLRALGDHLHITR